MWFRSFISLPFFPAGRTDKCCHPENKKKKKMDLSGIKRFLRQTDGAAGCRKCVQGTLGGIADASYVCQSRRRSTAKAKMKHITLFVFTQKLRQLQSSGCFMCCQMFPRSAADVLYRTVQWWCVPAAAASQWSERGKVTSSVPLRVLSIHKAWLIAPRGALLVDTLR